MKVNGNTILLTRSTIETSFIAGKLTFKLFVRFPKNFRLVSILFSACRRRTWPFSVCFSVASVSKEHLIRVFGLQAPLLTHPEPWARHGPVDPWSLGPSLIQKPWRGAWPGAVDGPWIPNLL